MEMFAKRLRQLRMEKDMKQSELAHALQVSQGMASGYENGREAPFDTLVGIAKYFDVTTDYLLGVSQVRKPSGDNLAAIVGAAAQMAEQQAMPATAPDAVEKLARLSCAYMQGDQPAGAAPMELMAALAAGMTQLLEAVNGDSTAAVLDASNRLLSTVVDVQRVTAEYLQRAKK